MVQSFLVEELQPKSLSLSPFLFAHTQQPKPNRPIVASSPSIAPCISYPSHFCQSTNSFTIAPLSPNHLSLNPTDQCCKSPPMLPCALAISHTFAWALTPSPLLPFLISSHARQLSCPSQDYINYRPSIPYLGNSPCITLIIPHTNGK
jgi:hypothetical protein